MRKNKIECPSCDKASGLALGAGFTRRNFLQLAEAPSVRIEAADNAAFDAAVTKITDVVRNSGVEAGEHADVLHRAAAKRA